MTTRKTDKQLRFKNESLVGTSSGSGDEYPAPLRKSSIDGIHDIAAVVNPKTSNGHESGGHGGNSASNNLGAVSSTPGRQEGASGDAHDREHTVFEEAEDCLAQSLLIFLYADLRLLSATGRISTKYETLYIASDEAQRTSSAHMAGISPDYASLIDDERTSKGISPAQIMAVLMIELRREVLAWRKTRHFEEGTSIMSTLFDKNDRKKIEDDMHGSLRCYNLMVGEDLRYDIPEFTASQPGTFRRPREIVDLIRLHMQERSSNHISSVQSADTEDGRGLSDTEIVMNTSNIDGGGDSSPSKMSSATAPATGEAVAAMAEVDEELTRKPLQRSRSFLTQQQEDFQQRRERFQEEFQKGRERVQQGVQRQTEVFREGEDAVARHQFEDVGDAFVRLAQEGGIDATGDLGTYRRKLSEEELLDYMEKAVESRDSGNLDFMNNFFKEGSVSQVMIKSQARVVWLNDFYPLKDCTYGISVDNERKRVLLVFRGAITRADWGHAGKMDLKKVENPIQEDFPSKSKHIKVHNGFYRFLFRVRKDTGTRKYDEIANILHHYGSKLGDEYSLVITGYSLGGALSTVFGLYASTDARFAKNGPIQLYTFGCPFVGGTDFYESFRHQERNRKLQLARFFNRRDGVTHLPVSWTGEYQHVGVGVRLPKVRSRAMRYLFPEPVPHIRYPKDKSRLGFYIRSLKENYFFNMPLPWKIRLTHSLNEVQKRMLRVQVLCENEKEYPLHNKNLKELYEELVYNDNSDKSGKNR